MKSLQATGLSFQKRMVLDIALQQAFHIHLAASFSMVEPGLVKRSTVNTGATTQTLDHDIRHRSFGLDNDMFLCHTAYRAVGVNEKLHVIQRWGEIRIRLHLGMHDLSTVPPGDRNAVERFDGTSTGLRHGFPSWVIAQGVALDISS